MPSPIPKRRCRRHAPRARRGQSTVEYMLVLSVIVISMVYTAWAFQPFFESGYDGLERDVEKVITSATSDGSNDMR